MLSWFTIFRCHDPIFDQVVNFRMVNGRGCSTVHGFMKETYTFSFEIKTSFIGSSCLFVRRIVGLRCWEIVFLLISCNLYWHSHPHALLKIAFVTFYYHIAHNFVVCRRDVLFCFDSFVNIGKFLAREDL